MLFKQKKALVLTDFDGTICTVDMGSSVLSHFTKKSWDEIDRDYVRGALGSREAYAKIASRMAATSDTVRKFVVKKGKIDPYFVRFCRLAKEKGVDVKIVSDGLDFYIRTVLEKYDLPDMDFYSNSLEFCGEKDVAIAFPHMNPLCGRCGTCKNKILNDHRLLYEQIIYVGDGHSDVCPSRFADLVFAKGVLWEKRDAQCSAAYMPFETFRDVSRYIKTFL